VRRSSSTHTKHRCSETLREIASSLAKAESTEFAEEAEAFSARAQELMAKYSIDHVLLAAQSGIARSRPAAGSPSTAPTRSRRALC